uniref:Uncharacterized protein LOC116947671 isoform X3 n=1 Tax=Petromyzon marinus TaxID=7757 RepID=A0AAJ7X347_PETMA|nr:uncharacterized protein LOC116947671 isoform X3 [Petromyzon marinus]
MACSQLSVQLMSWALGVGGVAYLFHQQRHHTQYGRYQAAGTALPARLAWFLQELPSFLVPVLLLLGAGGADTLPLPNALLLLMFCGHYFQRGPAVRAGHGDQHPQRQHPAGSATPRRHPLQHPTRGSVRAGVGRELPGRDRGVERLRAGIMVAPRGDLLHLHRVRHRASRRPPPQILPRKVQELPQVASRAHPLPPVSQEPGAESQEPLEARGANDRDVIVVNYKKHSRACTDIDRTNERMTE